MASTSPVDEAEAIVSEANALKFGFNLLSFLGGAFEMPSLADVMPERGGVTLDL